MDGKRQGLKSWSRLRPDSFFFCWICFGFCLDLPRLCGWEETRPEELEAAEGAGGGEKGAAQLHSVPSLHRYCAKSCHFQLNI
jgi:hypothetical protein